MKLARLSRERLRLTFAYARELTYRRIEDPGGPEAVNVRLICKLSDYHLTIVNYLDEAVQLICH